VISAGRVVADGTPAELEARSRHHNAVTVCMRGVPAEAARDELGRLPGVATVELGVASDGQLRLTVFPAGGGSVLAAVGSHIRQRGWQLDELHLEQGRLDDVFRAITTTRESVGAGAGS
jgi:ABC-2 type transport system ATP-binding protein